MGWVGPLDPGLLNSRLAFSGQKRSSFSPWQGDSPSSNLTLTTVRRFAGSSCRCLSSSVRRRPPSVSLTTKSEEVDVAELSALLATAKQNCEQFPSLLSDGSIVPVNPAKLRHALRHSTVVVGLYVERDEIRDDDGDDGASSENVAQVAELDLWSSAGRLLNHWKGQRTVPKTLVAFGRATSDHALTASIYDVVVSPPYRRLGLGSRVLLKIIKDLRKRGITDIAATPLPELRPFFKHCGFGPDALESVTMMYTRGPFSHTDSLEVKEVGRKALVIPPARAGLHSRL